MDKPIAHSFSRPAGVPESINRPRDVDLRTAVPSYPQGTHQFPYSAMSHPTPANSTPSTFPSSAQYAHGSLAGSEHTQPNQYTYMQKPSQYPTQPQQTWLHENLQGQQQQHPVMNPIQRSFDEKNVIGATQIIKPLQSATATSTSLHAYDVTSSSEYYSNPMAGLGGSTTGVYNQQQQNTYAPTATPLYCNKDQHHTSATPDLSTNGNLQNFQPSSYPQQPVQQQTATGTRYPSYIPNISGTQAVSNSYTKQLDNKPLADMSYEQRQYPVKTTSLNQSVCSQALPAAQEHVYPKSFDETRQTTDSSTSESLSGKSSSIPKIDTLTKSSNNRIDPAFLPRPLVATEPLQQLGGKRYETDKYTIPPPPFGTYTVVDKGSASCRFIRVSLNQVPFLSSTLKTSSIPFVTAIQPFPVLGEYEEPIPVINLNKGTAVVAESSDSEGPLRCFRCHAYASPHITFPCETTATCNFCGHTYTIPQHYQLALTEFSRLRQDYTQDTPETSPLRSQFERYELIRGAVDFVAPSAFLTVTAEPSSSSHHGPGIGHTRLNKKLIQDDQSKESFVVPPAFCFVIDTSGPAQKNGFMSAAISAIKYSLDMIQCDKTEIAIVTYDDAVHFFPLKASRTGNQQMFVVADIEDPFAPAGPEALFLNVMQHRQQIGAFLDRLTHFLEEEESQKGTGTGLSSVIKQSCGNAALKAAINLLTVRGGGGAVKIFYSTFPDRGVGSWSKAGITAKTKDAIASSLSPPTELAPFYNSLVGDCIHNGISIDMFIAPLPNNHVNVGFQTFFSRKTGGHCFYYGSFNLTRDFQQLCADVGNQMILPAGYDCVFKLRCSRGISVNKIYTPASFGKKDTLNVDVTSDPSGFRIPRIDSELSLVFQLQHDGEIPEGERCAFIQYACLHTTLDGKRRIRVVTVVLEVTSSLSTTFRYSEVECVLAYLIRKYGEQIAISKKTAWKEELIEHLVDVLFSYRLNCASNASPGQLILPDALKALPVYVSGMLKHPVFRSTSDTVTDEQDFLLVRLMELPLHQLIAWMYPRLYVLHRSYISVKGEQLTRIGQPTGIEGQVYLPPVVPCNGEKITTDGIFLLDNGIYYLLYVGIDVNSKILMETFGVSALTPENVSSVNPNALSGDLGKAIMNVLEQLRGNKGLKFPWQSVRVVCPRSLDESHFIWHLIEDRLGPEDGYVGFLCSLHKAVHKKMEDA